MSHDVNAGVYIMAMADLGAIGLVEEEVRRQLQSKRANYEWLEANKKGLRSKYLDKFVVVYNGGVIAAGRDLDGLFKRLRSKLAGEDLATVAVELIKSEDVIWIL